MLELAGHAGKLLRGIRISFVHFVHFNRSPGDQRFSVFALSSTAHGSQQRTKKPTWQNTRKCSATSVYFLTSPLVLPGCYLSSHPKHSRQRLLSLHPTFAFYGMTGGETRAGSRLQTLMKTGTIGRPVSLGRRLRVREENIDLPRHSPPQQRARRPTIAAVMWAFRVELPMSLEHR